MSRSCRDLFAACLAGALCWSTPIFAADMPARAAKVPPPAPPSAPPTWTFSVTPYAWLPSINGSTTVKGRGLDVDASFVDLLDRKIPKELFGLMGTFEARNGPISLWTDLVYMKVGASGSAARAFSVNRLVGGTLAASASVQFEMFIAEAVAAYEVFRWSAGDVGTQIDLYGGGRFWWQNADASLGLTAGLTVADLTISGGRAIAGSGGVAWFDPLVGMRLRHHVSPSTELVVRGDIGGFGAGSDFSWQAMGYVNWDFGRTRGAIWSAMLGYRALYVDYKEGSGNTLYQYDMLTHGPIVGVTAKF